MSIVSSDPYPRLIGRADQTAALLPDGNVLVVAGFGENGRVVASTELYNAATGLWTAGGSIQNFLWFHTETLMTDGSLLVVGGRADFSPYSYSEIASYDEANNDWSVIGGLNQGRFGHTATLLQDGRLLIAGGERIVGGPTVALAELIEPIGYH